MLICIVDTHEIATMKGHHRSQRMFGLLQSQIKKVRDKGAQLDEMHVPSNALDGHAFHTYTLTSPDDSVSFQFQHNVCGRQIYAEGTVDAAIFLSKQVKSQTEQRIFNMIDVLKAGAMR